MSAKFLMIVPTALTLAACSPHTPPATETPPPPSAEGASCGAGQFASYVGRKATDDVIAAITKVRGDQPIRILRPGTAMTMDYRQERLNVDIDEAGTIKRLYCA